MRKSVFIEWNRFFCFDFRLFIFCRSFFAYLAIHRFVHTKHAFYFTASKRWNARKSRCYRRRLSWWYIDHTASKSHRIRIHSEKFTQYIYRGTRLTGKNTLVSSTVPNKLNHAVHSQMDGWLKALEWYNTERARATDNETDDDDYVPIETYCSLEFGRAFCCISHREQFSQLNVWSDTRHRLHFPTLHTAYLYDFNACLIYSASHFVPLVHGASLCVIELSRRRGNVCSCVT